MKKIKTMYHLFRNPHQTGFLWMQLIYNLLNELSQRLLRIYVQAKRGYKTFFLLITQLSMKSKMLKNIEIAKIDGIFRFKSPKLVIYPAYKCLNANFNTYEQDNFYG